jgi:DNA invertase Pin-like site-specific DNA recombinase
MEADDRQAISIDSQLSEMKVIADREKLTIADIKTEAHSAKNSGQRVIFAEMIEGIKQGKYNAILTWNPDRLSRNAGDLGHLVDLMDKGLLLEIKTFGQTFSNSPNEKFLLMILCSQAKLENDNRGINVRRGLRTASERGLWPCSSAPIGYNKSKLVGEEGIVFVDRDRASFIKQAYEKMAYEDCSIYDIVKWFKEVGFTTRSGKFINYSQSHVMLHNPFYYGTFEYPKKSGKIHKGIHDPTIDKKLFDDVQEKIAQFQRKKKFRYAKTAPFGFLQMIRCGTCTSRISAEEKYKIRKISKKEVVYRYYACCRNRNRDCREPYINERMLMGELYKILSVVELDEIGLRELLEMEIDKWYKLRAFVQGKPVEDRTQDRKEYDLREYAKIIFKEGRIEEQREILSHMKGRLILKNKRIYLDTVPDGA